LSAALTGRIRNKSVALFEHLDFSQKLKKAPAIDNYLGIPAVTGKGLMQQFSSHTLLHEPNLIKEKVADIFPDADFLTVMTKENSYEAKTVILAIGVMDTLLFEGEREFLGRGVGYCATCDGRMFEGKDVAVISYTNEGEHEAGFLSEICRNVYYLPQYKGDFQSMRSELKIVDAKPKSIVGGGQVEKLVTEKEELKVHGVFILRKSDPVEKILPALELEGETIKVNRDMSTNVKGVFAAGDAAGKPYQIAKAVGEGLVAALSAVSSLDK
jgi:thioredoxin reductase (NADPH)